MRTRIWEISATPVCYSKSALCSFPVRPCDRRERRAGYLTRGRGCLFSGAPTVSRATLWFPILLTRLTFPGPKLLMELHFPFLLLPSRTETAWVSISTLNFTSVCFTGIQCLLDVPVFAAPRRHAWERLWRVWKWHRVFSFVGTFPLAGAIPFRVSPVLSLRAV